MAIKPVKHFTNAMAGAPVLSGTAGSLIAVLDACLVNGFNLLTLDSLAVSGNVLTGAKAGHGFVVDQVIATAANEAALTGEWTITSVTSGTFTADATGVADVTGTGTKTAKAAPAGWSKVYSAANKAAYKSIDPAASGCLLRVDDTGTTSARVVGYESMTDVDTGTGPFPTSAQVSGGGYWVKSQSADSTARGFLLVADAKTFYNSRKTYLEVQHFGAFGDFTSEKAGDAYNCMLQCDASVNGPSSWGYSQIGYYTFNDASASRLYSPRSYSQLGGAINMACAHVGDQNIPSGIGGAAYPSLASNGLVVGQITAKEIASGVIRSLALPGVYATPQTRPLNNLDKVSGIAALPGRTLIAAAIGFSSSEGRLFFDLTGPWA